MAVPKILSKDVVRPITVEQIPTDDSQEQKSVRTGFTCSSNLSNQKESCHYVLPLGEEYQFKILDVETFEKAKSLLAKKLKSYSSLSSQDRYQAWLFESLIEFIRWLIKVGILNVENSPSVTFNSMASIFILMWTRYRCISNDKMIKWFKPLWRQYCKQDAIVMNAETIYRAGRSIKQYYVGFYHYYSFSVIYKSQVKIFSSFKELKSNNLPLMHHHCLYDQRESPPSRTVSLAHVAQQLGLKNSLNVYFVVGKFIHHQLDCIDNTYDKNQKSKVQLQQNLCLTDVCQWEPGREYILRKSRKEAQRRHHYLTNLYHQSQNFLQDELLLSMAMRNFHHYYDIPYCDLVFTEKHTLFPVLDSIFSTFDVLGQNLKWTGQIIKCQTSFDGEYIYIKRLIGVLQIPSSILTDENPIFIHLNHYLDSHEERPYRIAGRNFESSGSDDDDDSEDFSTYSGSSYWSQTSRSNSTGEMKYDEATTTTSDMAATVTAVAAATAAISANPVPFAVSDTLFSRAHKVLAFSANFDSLNQRFGYSHDRSLNHKPRRFFRRSYTVGESFSVNHPQIYEDWHFNMLSKKSVNLDEMVILQSYKKYVGQNPYEFIIGNLMSIDMQDTLRYFDRLIKMSRIISATEPLNRTRDSYDLSS